jgi:hypothetical protein
MRPTSCAIERNLEAKAQEKAIAACTAAAPVPMRFTSTSSKACATQRGAEVDEEAIGDTDKAANATSTPPPRPPPRAAHSRGSRPNERKHDVTAQERIETLRKTLSRPSSATVRFQSTASCPHWLNGCLRDTSLAGVAVGNPRDGKTDAMYNVIEGSEVVRTSSPRVSMGTSPRFPGSKPCPPPHKQLKRPHSARVGGGGGDRNQIMEAAS